MRGYISYLRGEHPGKFPKRLYPDAVPEEEFLLNPKTLPKNDIFGNVIPPKEQLKNLKIIGVPMTDEQLSNYNRLDIPDEEDGEIEGQGSFNIIGMQVSNIVYPNTDEKSKPSENVGIIGLQRFLKREKKQYSIVDKFIEQMFSMENLLNYSAKIAKIISGISASEGIVFIYSRFLSSGVIPLAIALELNGFCKFGGSLIKGKKRSR